MTRTYSMLETYGVIDQPPATVNDQLLYGRFTQRPTPQVRYVPLAVAYTHHRLIRDIVADSVHLPCEIPRLPHERAINFWLSLKLGGNPTFEAVSAEDPYYTRAQYKKTMAEVQRISALPAEEQKHWYKTTAAKACEDRP
jgi:hypothetical protein